MRDTSGGFARRDLRAFPVTEKVRSKSASASNRRREMLRKTSAAGARAPLSPAGFPSKEETCRSSDTPRARSQAFSRPSPDPPKTHDAMPRSTAATLLVALAICIAAAGVSAQHHELHGSGTTNPSKFFWKVMDLMEERSRTPVTMTYRAVGTSRTRAREPVVSETRRVTFPPEKVTRKSPTFPRARRLNRSPPPLPMSSRLRLRHRHFRFHRRWYCRRPLQPLRLGRHSLRRG